ncbi:MAG: two-component system chemotaxis family response regulator CheB [Limisphaerales bacterium]|nr:MAG: two-component system chemotaxis family response regulator CheB [Limisphaerales bacterium]
MPSQGIRLPEVNPSCKIRVLVVDDSALVRKLVTDALQRDPGIEVVGTACDPYVARDKLLELNPDVLTLDIEMPRLDGLSFLKILQQHRPMPVIVISSLTQSGSRVALEALEAGAVDVLAKPSGANSIGQLAEQLAWRVRAAAVARLGAGRRGPAKPRLGNEAVKWHPRQLILLGASTGGVEALTEVLTKLPAGVPGICIAQHIPAHFSRMFAQRLAGQCAFEVREAADGDKIHAGLALVAPGDYHMIVNWHPEGYRVALNQKPPLHHCRPAVDMLFHSAASSVGRHAVAALLTGMGSDGAIGLQKLKAAGARTLAQDESTCLVYGMPRAAVDLGAVDQVLPLWQIPKALVDNLKLSQNQPMSTTT